MGGEGEGANATFALTTRTPSIETFLLVAVIDFFFQQTFHEIEKRANPFRVKKYSRNLFLKTK